MLPMETFPDGRFPFGSSSTGRDPRRPAGPARALVLGVYPSALHVRWTLPESRPDGLPAVVGALAVDDEPSVFWDGADEEERVEAWRVQRGFRSGNGPLDHGFVVPAGNGTSGRPVTDRVLAPLGILPTEVWFTDSINRYFVKFGGAASRQQGDVIRQVYDRFAASREGLSPADLPTRPSPDQLVAAAVQDHRDRLRSELLDSSTPLVITLGEEARRVLAAVVDRAEGPAVTPLTRGSAAEQCYGQWSEVVVGGSTMQWVALVHPGNRSDYWRGLHDRWVTAR